MTTATTESASSSVLTEPLAVTLMTHFLEHLYLLDEKRGDEMPADRSVVVQDAIVKNLVHVARFLHLHQTPWTRAKTTAGPSEGVPGDEPAASDAIFPPAVIVLCDKVERIGSRATHPAVPTASLKFFAAFLLLPLSADNDSANGLLDGVFIAAMRLIDRIQAKFIGRERAASEEWKACQTMAASLLGRIRMTLGVDRHTTLHVQMARRATDKRSERRQQRQQLVVADPQTAARNKSQNNRKRGEKRRVKRTEKSKANRLLW